MGCELPPPVDDLSKLNFNRVAELVLVHRGRFGPEPGTNRKDLMHQLDKVINAMITNRIFDRGKQAVVGVKAENVPRVNNRTTFDCPFEQLKYLGDFFKSLF